MDGEIMKDKLASILLLLFVLVGVALVWGKIHSAQQHEINMARSLGWDSGYDRGYEDGYEKGYDDGYYDGYYDDAKD